MSESAIPESLQRLAAICQPILDCPEEVLKEVERFIDEEAQEDTARAHRDSLILSGFADFRERLRRAVEPDLKARPSQREWIG
jgi:hypothetical protein